MHSTCPGGAAPVPPCCSWTCSSAPGREEPAVCQLRTLVGRRPPRGRLLTSGGPHDRRAHIQPATVSSPLPQANSSEGSERGTWGNWPAAGLAAGCEREHRSASRVRAQMRLASQGICPRSSCGQSKPGPRTAQRAQGARHSGDWGAWVRPGEGHCAPGGGAVALEEWSNGGRPQGAQEKR